MKNFIYFLLIFSLCYKSSEAQSVFEKNYKVPGDIFTSWSVITTSDGGYAVCGRAKTPANAGDYFLKTDSKGNPLFNGYINIPHGTAMVIRQVSGGYLIAGDAEHNGYLTSCVNLVDGSGNVSWTKFIGFEGYVTTMEPTTDGGFILGTFVGFNNNEVAKISSTGDTLWTRILSNTINSIKQTADSGFILTGAAKTIPYLMKLTSTGKISWTSQYPNNNNGLVIGEGSCVIQTADGGYAIAATAYPGFGMMAILKTDSKGDTLWSKILKHQYPAGAMSILQTKDGGYVLGGLIGVTHLGDTVTHPAMVKITSKGVLKWIRTYGPNYNNNFADMKATPDGGYVIAANCTDTIYGAPQTVLIKTDSLGLSAINEQGVKSFSALSVFPNPAHTIATFQINGFLVGSSYNFSLYNLQGRIINSISGIKSNRFEANVSELPYGTYVYKFVDENGNYSNGKIEIE